MNLVRVIITVQYVLLQFLVYCLDNNYIVVDYDILIPRAQLSKRREATQFYQTNKWPNNGRDIPYDTSTLTTSQADMVRRAISAITAVSCVNFKVRSTEQAYIFFRNTDSACNSVIGFVNGQTVSQIAGCGAVANIVHETLHALGFLHTMARWDRDDRLLFNASNSLLLDQYEIPEITRDTMMPGQYDYGSVMHYGSLVGARNRRYPTIHAPKAVGQRHGMSALDIELLNFMYPGTPQCAPTVRCITDFNNSFIGVGQVLNVSFSVSSGKAGTLFRVFSTLPQGALLHSVFPSGDATNVPNPGKVTYQYVGQSNHIDKGAELSVVFQSTTDDLGPVSCKAIIPVMSDVIPVNCFGLLKADARVCGGHGRCHLRDLCICDEGWIALQCTKNAKPPNSQDTFQREDLPFNTFYSLNRATSWSPPGSYSVNWILNVSEAGLDEFELKNLYLSYVSQSATTATIDILDSQGQLLYSIEESFEASPLPVDSVPGFALSDSGFGTLPVKGSLRITNAFPSVWTTGTLQYGTSTSNTLYTLGLEGLVRCKDGYFGPTCASECPGGAGSLQCYKNGLCHDGTEGSGICSCFTGFDPISNCKYCLGSSTRTRCGTPTPTPSPSTTVTTSGSLSPTPSPLPTRSGTPSSSPTSTATSTTAPTATPLPSLSPTPSASATAVMTSTKRIKTITESATATSTRTPRRINVLTPDLPNSLFYKLESLVAANAGGVEVYTLILSFYGITVESNPDITLSTAECWATPISLTGCSLVNFTCSNSPMELKGAIVTKRFNFSTSLPFESVFDILTKKLRVCGKSGSGVPTTIPPVPAEGLKNTTTTLQPSGGNTSVNWVILAVVLGAVVALLVFVILLWKIRSCTVARKRSMHWRAGEWTQVIQRTDYTTAPISHNQARGGRGNDIQLPRDSAAQLHGL